MPIVMPLWCLRGCRSSSGRRPRRPRGRSLASRARPWPSRAASRAASPAARAASCADRRRPWRRPWHRPSHRPWHRFAREPAGRHGVRCTGTAGPAGTRPASRPEMRLRGSIRRRAGDRRRIMEISPNWQWSAIGCAKGAFRIRAPCATERQRARPVPHAIIGAAQTSRQTWAKRSGNARCAMPDIRFESRTAASDGRQSRLGRSLRALRPHVAPQQSSRLLLVRRTARCRADGLAGKRRRRHRHAQFRQRGHRRRRQGRRRNHRPQFRRRSRRSRGRSTSSRRGRCPKSLVYPTLLSALRLQGVVAIEGNGVTKLVLETDAKMHGSDGRRRARSAPAATG